MIVVFAAGIISGMAAFGFALVAVPPLLLIYDPPTVTTVCLLLVMVTRLVVLTEVFRDVEWTVVATILPPAWAGTFVGLAMLNRFDTAAIELLAGTAVVLSAASMLAGWRIPGARSKLADLIAGLGSGVLSTTTGMAGPPIILLFTSRQYSTNIFRGTMTIIFYALSVVSLAQLARGDLIGREDFKTTLILLPAAMAGTICGQRLLRRFTASQFTRMVLLLLLVTGTAGVLTALYHLLG